MRHDVHIDGLAYRLRPIRCDDAEFVVTLRNDPHLGRYLHSGATDITSQIFWFEQYFQRDRDYYFVVERRDNDLPEGVIAIYDVDTGSHEGEWGRWILRPGSLAAVESAYLIYRVAFDILGLNEIFCRTVADNEKVVSFHDSCEINNRRLLRAHFEIAGRAADAIEHRLDRKQWKVVAPRLEKLARLSARRTVRD